MFNTIKAIGEPQRGGVAHDMLASIHQHLSQHGVWVKGTPGPGQDCLSTAIQRECHMRGMNSRVCDILHRHVMKAIIAATQNNAAPEPVCNWIPGWNDVKDRTLGDILTVLTMATLSAHEIDDEIITQTGISEDQCRRDLKMTAAPCADAPVGMFYNHDYVGAGILGVTQSPYTVSVLESIH